MGEDPSHSRAPAQPGNGLREEKWELSCAVCSWSYLCLLPIRGEALSLKLASLLSEHRVQFNEKFIFILPIRGCEEDVCQGFESPTRWAVAVQCCLQSTIMGSSKSLVGGTLPFTDFVLYKIRRQAVKHKLVSTSRQFWSTYKVVAVLCQQQ